MPEAPIVRFSTKTHGGSYLYMLKKAMDWERERQVEHSLEFRLRNGLERVEPSPSLENKSKRFDELLQVPTEERDRVQWLQVINRPDTAIAAARALIQEFPWRCLRLKKVGGEV